MYQQQLATSAARAGQLSIAGPKAKEKREGRQERELTMEIAPLLLGFITSLAKDLVAGGVRAAIAGRTDLVECAISVTSRFFPDIEGVKTGLRNWTARGACPINPLSGGLVKQ